MAYCTVANVERVMQEQFLVDTGYPNKADAQAFVDGVAAELDGIIQASGYPVPVTAIAGVAMLKEYNAYGAACKAWGARYRSETTPDFAKLWCDTYTAFIGRLRRNEQQIPGLVPEGDLFPSFAIVQHPSRDAYWTGDNEPLED